MNELKLFSKSTLIFSSILCLAACGVAVSDNQDARRAAELPYLEYSNLSSEAKYPYPQFKEKHAAASLKYLTVQDCLIESQKTSSEPDLRLINWDRVRTLAGLEVCLFRIFKSLDTPESIFKWLSFHYATTGLHSNPKDPASVKLSNYRPHNRADGIKVHNIQFKWRGALPFDDKNAPNVAIEFSIIVSFLNSDKSFENVYCNWLNTF